MGLKNAQQKIDLLTDSIGAESIELLPGEKSRIVSESESFEVHYDENFDRLYFCSEITQKMPENPFFRIKIYELLLETQHDFGEFQLGRIGKKKGNQNLILTVPISAQENLLSFFPEFIHMVRIWRMLLKIYSKRKKEISV